MLNITSTIRHLESRYWPLVKGWQTGLLLLTALAGYLSTGRFSGERWTLFGLVGSLFLAIGGATALNMWFDRDIDWPGCYGRIVPPPQVNALIGYLHRFVAALTSPFIIAAAVVSWWRARPIRWVSRPPLIAIPFLLAVIVFGALAVLRGLPRGVAAVDLGSALIVLALMTTATTAVFAQPADPELPDRLSVRDARLEPGALGTTFIVLASGVLVAGQGSLTRCLGWPMGHFMDYDLPGWPQAARLLVAGVASVLIVAVVVSGMERPV